MENEVKTLGDRVRDTRIQQEKSLRQLAKDLNVTPSYLSDIENNRRVPAEAVLLKISQVLKLNFNELMSLAGRFGEKAEKYVRRQPMAVQLFRRIAEENLDEEKLKRLLDQVEKEKREK
ncbi:helix-turn-helix transcriptional regulator [Dehalococcoides sp.]|uniref:helix-turn-helix domain-containing protein n=1 Tax=Dehalococcoides sp. TaxID=1966486 RepID=UPI002ACB0A37|nr:helix-turn-helix transcriptional regulator [Dehalococcoides sp.]